jgi:hypothetical protein
MNQLEQILTAIDVDLDLELRIARSCRRLAIFMC